MEMQSNLKIELAKNNYNTNRNNCFIYTRFQTKQNVYKWNKNTPLLWSSVWSFHQASVQSPTCVFLNLWTPARSVSGNSLHDPSTPLQPHHSFPLR